MINEIKVDIEYNDKMLDKLLNMSQEGFEIYRKNLDELRKDELHDEDMRINPDRHLLKENKYSRYFYPCRICNPDLSTEFSYLPSLDLFVRNIK
jgi:hypothetical protein